MASYKGKLPGNSSVSNMNTMPSSYASKFQSQGRTLTLMPSHRVAPNTRRLSRSKSAEAGGAEDNLQDVVQRRFGPMANKHAFFTNLQNKISENIWIRRIKRRECVAFVPKDGTQVRDSVCMCGRPMSEHTDNALHHKLCSQPWKSATHTEKMPTNAYGQIEFVGYRQQFANYIRLDSDTSVENLLKLLTEFWCLDHPNMLITVTGGAKTFKLKPRLKEQFRKGLMKVAHSTGAWIVSGGMYAGVMRLVGDAVHDFDLITQKKAVAIGIAPWGCVQDRNSLIKTPKTVGQPAQYRIETPVNNESPIDPNHSHFIFVDNGTIQKFGTEIKLRALLEEAVSSSNMQQVTGNEDGRIVKVPIVMVVLEGGPGTLETVYSALQKGTPAVIVAGSGRAADILAHAYMNAHEEELTVIDQNGKKLKKKIMGLASDIEVEISEKIKDCFGSDSLSKWVGWVKESVQKYDLLTIYQMESVDATDLDVSILHALLKANKEQVLDQIQLALSWNRIDVVKNMVFTEDREWKTGELNGVMFSAILLDRVEFVDLFLDNGVSLKRFLTVDRLLKLYNEIPERCILRHIIRSVKRERHRHAITLEDIGRLIKYLVGDFFDPLYLRDDYKLHADNSSKSKGHEGGPRSEWDRPERELFIWALLMNRPDMAEFFWNMGQDPLCAALFANKILKSIVSHTHDTDLKAFTIEHAKKYEDLAIGVLTECHSVDEEQAQLLLVRKLPFWGGTNSLVMAVEASNKQFIAHPACQSLLNAIWYSHLSHQNYFLMIALAALFPPFLFSLKYVRLAWTEQDPDNDTSDEQPTPPDVSNSPAHMDGKGDGKELVEMKSRHGSMDSIPPQTQEPEVKIRPRVGPCRRIMYFFTAPVVRFTYHVVFYIMFLLLYSYHLLVDFYPRSNPRPIEWILICCVASILLEEVRQFISSSRDSFMNKLKTYLQDEWNLADLVTIFLFITGLVLRFVAAAGHGLPGTDEGARTVLAFNLVTFYLRLLHIFSVNKNLGPKLVMIGRMMVDLFYFVGILLVFIVSYGIASQSLINPNTDFRPKILIDIVHKAYFQIFGELFLEELKSDKIDSAETVVPIMLGLYMLLSNVLLLNLLIAMFSFTFTAIQENTDIHWYFQRYSLIHEYYEKPLLPPPFIILSHLYRLVRFILKCCRRQDDMGFRKTFDEDDDSFQAVSVWEDLSRDEYNRKKHESDCKSIEYQVAVTAEKVDSLHSKINEIQEQQKSIPTITGQTTPAGVPRSLDQRLRRVEDHMATTFEALDFLIKSLTENKLGSRSTKPPSLPNLKKEAQIRKEKELENAEREKEMVKYMIEKRVEIHTKSRISPYPGSEPQVHRFPVPDEKVPWEIRFPEYSPNSYTAKKVLDKPYWADPVDLLQLSPASRPDMEWYKYDAICKTDRSSYIGKYKIEEGLPLNPRGRTGIVGRGLLGRWGPNHAGDPIVTRWKRDQDGNQMYEDDKQLLEFAATQRRDNKQWCFPGGILKPGADVSQTLKKEFTEEAMGNQASKVDQERIDKLFMNGTEVFRGYADDPRNTDNAWIETRAVHYHDETGEILQNITLRAGLTEVAVTWLTASSKISMYGSHQFMMKKVVDRMNCAY